MNKKKPLIKGPLMVFNKLSVSLFPLNKKKPLLHTNLISHRYFEVETHVGHVYQLSQYKKSTQSSAWVLLLSEKCVWGVSDFINLHLALLK